MTLITGILLLFSIGKGKFPCENRTVSLQKPRWACFRQEHAGQSLSQKPQKRQSKSSFKVNKQYLRVSNSAGWGEFRQYLLTELRPVAAHEDAVTGFSMHVRGDKHARVGISVGTATFGIDGETLDQLLIVADQAMYRVKSDHKQNRTTPIAIPQPSANVLMTHPINERTDDELASTSVN
jgi:hypothetical protein